MVLPSLLGELATAIVSISNADVTPTTKRIRITIARAILGHPFLTNGPMPTHNRPPEVNDSRAPHDSTIARPGIPNGKGQRKDEGRTCMARITGLRGKSSTMLELSIAVSITGSQQVEEELM